MKRAKKSLRCKVRELFFGGGEVETCLYKQRELVSLECLSESPGGLVKTDC